MELMEQALDPDLIPGFSSADATDEQPRVVVTASSTSLARPIRARFLTRHHTSRSSAGYLEDCSGQELQQKTRRGRNQGASAARAPR